jgi:hypothetical protein
MPDGWGYAAGEGAEAFSNALWPTLNYQVSRAQQQLQAGIEKEKLRLQQEQAKLEAEATRVAINQGNFALTKANFELEKAKQIEEDVQKAAEKLHPAPQMTEITKSVKAGKKMGFPKFQQMREKVKGERAFARLQAREAPGQFAKSLKDKETDLKSTDQLRAQVLENPSDFPKELHDYFTKGKETDQTAQYLRVYGQYYKDYLDREENLPIMNIMRESQGLPPLPEMTFAQYTQNIISQFGQAMGAPISGGKVTISPKDEIIFNLGGEEE